MAKTFKKPARIGICLLAWMLTFSTGASTAQIATNGSFENTAAGQVTGNDIDGWVLELDSGAGAAAAFEIVEDTVQQGSRALKAVVDAMGSSPWHIQVIADSLPVEPGATYLYSIWAKTNNPGSQANFTVGNYDFKEYGVIRPATLTDQWKEYKFEFTISDQKTFARAPIHFSLAANVNDTIYLDNLRIIDKAMESASRYPIVFQADSGDLGNDFAVLEEGPVRFIRIMTNGADYTPAIWNYPGLRSRVATYTVQFPAAGTYDLFARIRVGPLKFDDDSFFYGNGFGEKDTVNADDWIGVNQLQTSGFSDPSHVVHEPGGLGEGVWKWVNLSKNSYYEAATAFDVEDDGFDATLQIGGRETGLEIDRFAFGRSDLYFTAGDLENGEPGSDQKPGEVWEGPPLADGTGKFFGSVYSTPQAPGFEAYWNQVTPENAGKWGSVEGTRDIMNWGGLDAAYNFAKDHGFKYRHHVLIWGNQQPGWIEALANSPDEQLAEIREWFEAVAERYPAIDYLEVVNEPLHDPPNGATNGNYMGALGGSGTTGWDWVLNAFRMAREIFPSTTKLIINEFSITNDVSSARRYLGIIRLLQAENLIDGIGVQGHAFSTRSTTAVMKTCLDSLAKTGLPIQVTEMDIDGPTDAVQLADYQRIFPAFWEHPAVIGVTLWGWKPGLWRNTEKAYLVELNGDERPALEWLRGYVRSSSGVEQSPQAGTPRAFHLSNNYPNPFNPATRISYSVPRTGFVSLKVYNRLGRETATLFEGIRPPGDYSAVFDGSGLAGGVYLFRLKAEGFSQTRKLILLK